MEVMIRCSQHSAVGIAQTLFISPHWMFHPGRWQLENHLRRGVSTEEHQSHIGLGACLCRIPLIIKWRRQNQPTVGGSIPLKYGLGLYKRTSWAAAWEQAIISKCLHSSCCTSLAEKWVLWSEVILCRTLSRPHSYLNFFPGFHHGLEPRGMSQ